VRGTLAGLAPRVGHRPGKTGRAPATAKLQAVAMRGSSCQAGRAITGSLIFLQAAAACTAKLGVTLTHFTFARQGLAYKSA
jgi:hypothetical protein